MAGENSRIRTLSSAFGPREISPPPSAKRTSQSATGAAKTPKSQPMADFFKPRGSSAFKKSNESISWRVVDNSCLVGRFRSELAKPERPSEALQKDKKGVSLAVFDLDSTLIKTKSGNTFPSNADDWRWWDTRVPDKIRELSVEGYRIVIMTNQKKVLLSKPGKASIGPPKSLTIFKSKSEAITRALSLDLSLYAATKYDKYRKPRMGMWKLMLDDFDLDLEGGVDFENSIFVGDAAGRPGDHSCVDRNFATNAGIRFYTPEEFFLGKSAEPVDLFDPKTFVRSNSGDESPCPFAKAAGQELVIFCGSPGAGKSTFYWKFLQPLGYKRVNQDILKSRPKCLKVANDELGLGNSVAVDNTNANAETRSHWINLASQHGVPIRCIYLSTPKILCKHNDAVRAANPELEPLNPENRPSLPIVAFEDYAKRFEEPLLSEGFKEIIRVDFQFQGNATIEETWSQHWI